MCHFLKGLSRLQPVFRETRPREIEYVINDIYITNNITKITTVRVKMAVVRGARDEFGQLEMLKG